MDPFVYEIDGAVPVMPTLPIVETNTKTDDVVARQESGEHYAWKLMPQPYPTEGNIPVVPSEEQSTPATETTNCTEPRPEPWTNTEVVTEDQTDEHGDCFYAQQGDVISIDGNRGFDHIDLRSYSIEDATFQQGAILLHSGFEPTEVGEGEEIPVPITIQHRGVEFAIFKGEVRVEL